MNRKQYGLMVLLPVAAAFLFNLSTTMAGASSSSDARPAIAAQHFPDRLHTFIWRNWQSVTLERMAKVVGTTPENVREIGLSMGLPPHVPPQGPPQGPHVPHGPPHGPPQGPPHGPHS